MMRQLVLFIATSLDGYIAGPGGETDWLFTDQDYGFDAFYETVDTAIMGRKTFESATALAEDPFPGKTLYVFTRGAAPPDARAIRVNAPPHEFIRGLQARPGGHIWLVGGGQLVAECLRHDLVDAFHVFVHPLVLGDGIPLFPAPEGGTGGIRRLRACGIERFDTGLVRLDYLRARNLPASATPDCPRRVESGDRNEERGS